MLNYKSKGIQKHIFDRICQIHDEILNQDKEFLELGELSSQLMKQLFAKLSSEDRELLDQYDCGRMEQLNRQDEVIYSQGLIDGIILCYWVERIGRGKEQILV